ncbi:MAG TPA: DUF2019 domain-containing protein [Silvibacterium sp.]|nr:DUF2019 domain-containing protein [Silvibacterium sp.]
MDRLDELIQTLVEKNILRGAALEANTITKANRLFDQIAKISRELLQFGDPAHAKILALLTHENPYVLKWAAFLSLEFNPSKGEQVLEQLAQAYVYRGFADPKVLQVGFSSEMTLKQWRRGELKFVSQWKHRNS